MSTLWKAVFVLAVVGEVCCDPPGTCSLCPPGTFLTHMCALDVDTQCLPCDEGTFSATASHLKQCSTCSECPDGMFVDKPCQTIANTVCAPCSSVPSVQSDHFAASCERANAEGRRVDLDNMMMADAPNDAKTSANHAAQVENTEYDGDNKATEGQANSTNDINVDSDYIHNEAGDTKEATKELPTNASVLPDNSITNLEHDGDLADKIMNNSGDRRSDTNNVNTDEDQNSTKQENKHNDKAILKPSPAKDQESDNTTDLAILSPHGNSSLDEVRLEAVKFHDGEEETNRKREMNDLYNQTVVSHNEQFSESRLSGNAASGDNRETNNTDKEVEETQADAPAENEPKPEEVDIHTLSDNRTDHNAGNSSDAPDKLASEKHNSAKVPNEDSVGRKRAAIILGVAIAGMVFFVLVFFASRCWKRRRGKFKEMTKVNNYDQEEAERHPLSYSDTGSHEDPDAEVTNGLHRQGPPLGPSSPRTNLPKEEKPQPSEIQVAPETSMTIPLLTVSPAPEDLPESLSDHEPLVGDVDKLKYIDESTDDEYVMAILNKIPFSRLSYVVEEPLSTLPSTQQTIAPTSTS